MKPSTFFLLIIILIFSSCRKKNQEPQMTTVIGQVLTKGTEDPIKHPPVKVQIVERVPATTWGSVDNYEPVTETMSGEDHSFSLSHELDPEKEYYLAVEESTVKHKHHYLAPVWHYDRHRIKTVGGTINLNYTLSAYGWVEFHFVSEHPEQGDIFSYNLGGGGMKNFTERWMFTGYGILRLIRSIAFLWH